MPQIPNNTLSAAVSAFISELESSIYFKEFHLSFGEDVNLLGINIDIDFNFSQKTSYGVELESAYPKTINAIELRNDLDGLLSLSVTFAHRQWRRI